MEIIAQKNKGILQPPFVRKIAEMLKVSRKKKGKREKEMTRKGKRRKRKKERKDSVWNGAVYRGKRRNCVRRSGSAKLATRKEKILLSCVNWLS